MVLPMNKSVVFALALAFSLIPDGRPGPLHAQTEPATGRNPAHSPIPFAEDQTESSVDQAATQTDSPSPRQAAGADATPDGDMTAEAEAAAETVDEAMAGASDTPSTDTDPVSSDSAVIEVIPLNEDGTAESVDSEETITGEVMTGGIPEFETEDLPSPGEILPDESLLIDAPGYVPSYEEIVRQSEAIVREYEEPGLEMRRNVSLREARTRALADEEIRQAREAARNAPFHSEQREAWHAFYTLLYDRMASISPDLKEEIESRKNEEMARLGYFPADSSATEGNAE